MSAQPGTIEACQECEININSALCPDDCEVYQELRAEYEYEMRKEGEE